MPELKSNCKLCDVDLPVEPTRVFICTSEFTFCMGCVEDVLSNVCPNCDGGFSSRPIRQAQEYRSGASWQHQGISKTMGHIPYTIDEVVNFGHDIRHITLQER